MNLSMLWEFEQRQKEEAKSDNSKEDRETISKINSMLGQNGHALDVEQNTTRRFHVPSPYVRVASTSEHVKPEIPRATRHLRSSGKSDKSSDSAKKTSFYLSKGLDPSAAMTKIREEVSELRMKTKKSTVADPGSPFKKYGGDIFGTRGSYVDGMMYRSRLQNNRDILFGDQEEPAENTTNAITDAPATEIDVHPVRTPANVDEIEGARRYASTLCNWSFVPGNAQRLVEEGTIEALMEQAQLCDSKTRRYCATAFRNLSCIPEIRTAMVQSGIVPTIVELATQEHNETIQCECAYILGYLSCISGAEAQLVESGAVQALSFLMGDNESVAGICQWALFNLTCVDHNYYLIERVIKAFIALASAGHPSTPEVCASALYNLSCIPRIRMRLIEEGVIQVMNTLARLGDRNVRHLLAFVAYHLSLMKGCRTEIVTKGIMNVFSTLMMMNDSVIRHIVVASLENLCQEPLNSTRLIDDGIVKALSSIGKGSGNTQTTQLCGSAMLLLSTKEDDRLKIVEKGGVSLLSSLAHSTDRMTQEICTLALCNLLTVEQAAYDILKFGAISSLIQLSATENEETRCACAEAMYNLAKSGVAKVAVGSDPIIPSIRALSKTSKLRTKLYCASALCHLLVIPDVHVKFREAGIISSLVDFLNCSPPNALLIRSAAGAMCLLAEDPECAVDVIEAGALEPLISASKSNDPRTRMSCCTMFASMSYHPKSRRLLVHSNILPALVELAKSRDPEMQQRCAATLGNLSGEKELQRSMIDHGFVEILTNLSNSYSEDNQKHCAKALCNLTCAENSETLLVEQGTVSALLMIAMVRAVCITTKETCARALVNLMTIDTMKDMVNTGLIHALTNLSELHSEDCSESCALAFYMLIVNDEGRKELCQKQTGISALLALVSRTNITTRTRQLVGDALCHLVHYDDSRLVSVKAGVVKGLEALANNDSNLGIFDKVSKALLQLSSVQDCRSLMLEYEALPLVVRTLERLIPDIAGGDEKLEEVVHQLVQAMFNCAADDSMRPSMCIKSVGSVLISLVAKNPGPNILKICAATLCFLSLHAENCPWLLTHHILDAVEQFTQEKESILLFFSCIILRETFVVDTSTDVDQVERVLAMISHLIQDLQDIPSLLSCSDILCVIAFGSTKINFSTKLIEKTMNALKLLPAKKSASISRRCAASIRVLAEAPSARINLVLLGATKMLAQTSTVEDVERCTLFDCAVALQYLAQDSASKVRMVEEGAVPTLINLSEVQDAEIEEQCAEALSHLSAASHDLDKGTVHALINMSRGMAESVSSDEDFTTGRKASLKPKLNATQPERITTRNIPTPVQAEAECPVSIESFATEKLPSTVGVAALPPVPVRSLVSDEMNDEDILNNNVDPRTSSNSKLEASGLSASLANDEILSQKLNLTKIEPDDKKTIVQLKRKASTNSSISEEGNEISNSELDKLDEVPTYRSKRSGTISSASDPRVSKMNRSGSLQVLSRQSSKKGLNLKKLPATSSQPKKLKEDAEIRRKSSSKRNSNVRAEGADVAEDDSPVQPIKRSSTMKARAQELGLYS